MKKLLLLVALAPIVPASAQATMPMPALQSFMLAPGTRAGTSTSTGALPPGGIPLLDCANTFDKLVADLDDKNISTVNSTLLVGEQALAESPALGGSGGGFNPTGGQAALAGGKINGTSYVAAPGGTTRNDLVFSISKVSGKAKINWTHKGKAYASNVDSCSNGYWIASSASSAIAVKLGAPQSVAR
jgi:hypothetical protein